MMPIRILLLQARDLDDPVREEERRSFAQNCAVDLDRIETHDLIEGPPSQSRLQQCDAVMVGGSGDFHVSDRSLPRIDATLDFLAELGDKNIPVFASCFGFQLMVEALGGSIVHDPIRTEVGTFDLTLTEEGETDSLTGVLPKVFAAQLGHKDRADRLPDGAVHLVSSELNYYQAFRVPGKPIWATQFHPELDMATNRQRFERYLDGYAKFMTPDERAAALDGFRDSPETSRLLQQFLSVVFG